MSSIRFFDAHCDAGMKAFTGEGDFLSGEGSGHVTLPFLLEGQVAVQIFACFVSSERHPGREQEQAIAILEAMHGWIRGSGGKMSLIETADDLAALFALEGGDPLRGCADSLRAFAKRGVRLIIPAWSDNPFSGTAFGTNSPLTSEGEKLIAIAEEEGVAVDVSHLSDRAFDDVARLAKRPLLASHSNCRALCPHPRNLDDRRLRALAGQGGVVGINLSPLFLDPAIYAQARPYYAALRDGGADSDRRRWAADGLQRVPPCDPAWIVRHIRHAIAVGGEDCVGLGGDLDGIPQLPAGFRTVADYPRLLPLMEHGGLGSRQIEKVCYANFVRLFEQLLPDSLPAQSS